MTSRLTPEAGYVPGPWVGMAGGHVWLLADLDPTDPVVATCWDLVRSGATADALLAAMAGSDRRPAQHVAIVRLDGRRAEVTVRGDAWVDVSTEDGEATEVRAEPGGVASRTVEPLTAVRLHGAAGSDEVAALPLGSGVVTAARITVRGELTAEPAPTTTDGPGSVPVGVERATVDGPAAEEEPAPAPPDSHGSAPGAAAPWDGAGVAGGQPEPITPDSLGAGAAGPVDRWFMETVLPESEPEQAISAPPEWLPGANRTAAPTTPPRPAEVPQAGLAASSATLPPEHTSTTVGPDAYRSPFEGPFAGSLSPGGAHPGPPTAPANSGIIDDVSWAIVPDEVEPAPYPPPYQPPASAPPYPAPSYPAPSYPAPSYPASSYPAPQYPASSSYPAPPPPAPQYAPPSYPASAYPAPPAAPPGAHPTPYAAAAPGYAPAPGQSPAYPPPGAPAYPGPAQPGSGDMDPALMETRHRPPTRSGAAGPLVTAVRCEDGHPNPPAAQTCRVCAKPIPPQTPQSVPRPTLGVLRLSTGEVVRLDRGVILGRAPGSPQGFGPDEPHRIQLPSPDASISRRHVEVVLDGWNVTVVDLESTNGTVVTPPGGVAEKLPRGGRKVIEHGWVVSLDDATWFSFEVTP